MNSIIIHIIAHQVDRTLMAHRNLQQVMNARTWPSHTIPSQTLSGRRNSKDQQEVYFLKWWKLFAEIRLLSAAEMVAPDSRENFNILKRNMPKMTSSLTLRSLRVMVVKKRTTLQPTNNNKKSKRIPFRINRKHPQITTYSLISTWTILQMI
jgi:hypothetical protein